MCVFTAFVAKTVPLPYVSTAFAAKTVPLPCGLPAAQVAAQLVPALGPPANCPAAEAAEAAEAAAAAAAAEVGAEWRRRQDPEDCGDDPATGKAGRPRVLLVELGGFRHGLGAQIHLVR